MTPSQPENFFQFEKLLVQIVRATDNVDILIDAEKTNVEKLLNSLSLGATVGPANLRSRNLRHRKVQSA
jgi:hypothetical protein